MTHVSDFDLDGLRLGQLDDERKATVEAHLAACDECSARRDALAADAAVFDVPLDLEATLAASDNVVRPAFGRRALPFLIGAAAAALFVFVARPESDTVRTKGGDAALELFLADGDQLERVVDDVPTGATVRVRLDPGERAYVRMWWGDDALWPAADAPAVHLDTLGPQWLDHPVHLDDDPRPEIVEAIFCDSDFGDDARQAVPEGCRQVRMEVKKRP